MKRIIFAALIALSAHMAYAQTFHQGALTIDQPWTRVTPAAVQNGAIYLSIQNRGQSTDRLLSVTSNVADKVQIHRSSIDNGIMRMRAVKGGVILPAAGRVSFAPGGLHIMLFGLKHSLNAGEHFNLTLHFEHAGDSQVEVEVRDAEKNHGWHGWFNENELTHPLTLSDEGVQQAPSGYGTPAAG